MLTPLARNATTAQDARHEPVILSDLLLDNEPDERHSPGRHRTLPITLLLSVLAHLALFGIAALAAKRDGSTIEQAVLRPSIQIRFQQPPPTTEAESPADSVDATTPTEPAPPSAAPPSLAPTETIAGEPQRDEPAGNPDLPPTSTQPVPLPSLNDLRTAARNRAEQDRRSRGTHPDCLARERRSGFVDCEEGQNHDFASADVNATYDSLSATLSAQPDQGLTPPSFTRARVKAALDMFDAQLGTTKVKKSIMEVQ
ncbi:hypothetical protein [Pseudohongiella acticola]|jgi:hypothetical protein|uniref:hypothetical protein n=1 Tax=Pseudohongiella acticola TaxID=1524254 RepID=UPI0011130BD8|nr:hypothetical protein [Pseudohongiella acticola]